VSSPSPFGQNEWLVEEMYRKFREDPSSVNPSWHEFLVDYSPEPTTEAQTTTGNGQPGRAPAAPAPMAPPEPMPKQPEGNGVAAPTKEPEAAPAKPKAPAGPQPAEGDEVRVLRGAAAAVVKNMSASLEVPTATSVRAIPAKLMIDNRVVINNHLKRTRGGKISFTHLIGYALVQAVKKFPNMNRHFAEVDGKPNAITPEHINLGLAIDLQGRDGNRQLVVAAIKGCEAMRFGQFIAGYEDIVRRARDGKLSAEDFSGVTISLTNPGTIGTVHSVPRLMRGQGAIIGVGAMEYPAEFQGASAERISEMGVGKLVTFTSTYDHRIIQGAESGDFLRTVHELLLSDDFFDEIFRELGIPYEPVRWRTDNPDSIEDKNARVIELIAAYRNRGHLMADIDPLRLNKTRFRSHPDLDVATHGLTLWDLDREFKVNGFAGAQHKKLRDVLGLLRDAYCRHVGVEYTHILEPEQQQWLEERVEVKHDKPTVAQQKYILSKLNAAEAFETFLHTKYVGQKRFSLEGAETVIPTMDAVIDQAAEHGLNEVVIGMPHRGRLNVLANIVGKPYSQILLAGIKRISRRAMSAPSSGSSKVHAVEQQEILDEAFTPQTNHRE
jgi:multifunctional 2-oxoglutarate metabolism enzyme